MITAVIIDDDINLRNSMRGLLSRYAPDVIIVGEADNVIEGVTEIISKKPLAVFLDIQLTKGTGFDILERISKIEGEVKTNIVFVTAYEKYAIKAFRFSALDFLLKPIDPDELKEVIRKLKKQIAYTSNYSNIKLLLENLSRNTNTFERIALSTANGIHLFEIKNIIRCESKDNYTQFYFKNQKPILISKTLKEYEELLTVHGFERIHQSHLINLAYLKSYIKKDGGYVLMSDGSNLPIAQRKKDRLKELLNINSLKKYKGF